MTKEEILEKAKSLNDSDDYDALISLLGKAYDESENDWCGHIINYYKEAMSYRILDYLRKQGFDPKK